jgi:hypothetical protein
MDSRRLVLVRRLHKRQPEYVELCYKSFYTLISDVNLVCGFIHFCLYKSDLARRFNSNMSATQHKGVGNCLI